MAHRYRERLNNKYQLIQMDPRDALCHVQSPAALYRRKMLNDKCDQHMMVVGRLSTTVLHRKSVINNEPTSATTVACLSYLA